MALYGVASERTSVTPREHPCGPTVNVLTRQVLSIFLARTEGCPSGPLARYVNMTYIYIYRAFRTLELDICSFHPLSKLYKVETRGEKTYFLTTRVAQPA